MTGTTTIKYMVKDGKRRTTLSYQRAWPTRLKATAKAMGYGASLKMSTGLALDSPLGSQEEAVEAGHAEWQRLCGLMDAYSRATDMAGTTMVLPKRLKDSRDSNRLKQMAASHTRTLAQGLQLYLDSNPPPTEKSGRERKRYWSEWMGHVAGDHVLKRNNPQAIEAIERAFDDWQADMLARSCTHETVARARSAVVSVVRWLSEEYRLGWHVQLKRLPQKKRTAKATLSVAEQKRLLRCVVEDPGATSAMVAVMLAGGVMASEIKRMDPEAVSVSLAAEYPYVAVGANDVGVKTEARRRFVPIVWSTDVLEVVQEYLPSAIVSLKNTSDPAARVNKWLKARGFEGITGHSLRHTMASAATAALANPLVLARVGGWSGSGLNPVMLGYGSGDESTELIRTLSEECRRWFGQVC